jgi:hypothetical protein
VKTLIPWLCVVALAAGAGLLYSTGQKKDVELATLRTTAQETEQLRAENVELKNAQISHDEITRLRKESEDVVRLRNQVRQLTDQMTQLTRQLETAQTTAQKQQQQVQKLQSENQQAIAAARQAQQAAQPQAKPQLSAQEAVNACINNLRQLDGAKQQWALEHNQTAQAVPTAEQIAAYLKDNVLPVCPAGGNYTSNAVGQVPTCSIQGHALQQQ